MPVPFNSNNTPLCLKCGWPTYIIGTEDGKPLPVCTSDTCNIQIEGMQRKEREEKYKNAVKDAANPNCAPETEQIIEDEFKAAEALRNFKEALDKK